MMIGFREKWEMAPRWQKKNCANLITEFEEAELTDNEKSKLLWLGAQDRDTIETFVGLFKKCKEVK